MLESLTRIKNPLTRSLVAAATIGSVITLASSLVIGVTNTKTSSAYRTAVYSALLGTGCGAVFGLVSAASQENSENSNQQDAASAQTTDSNHWQNWRNFVVVRKVKESEEITSFYLQPEDGKEIPNFQPGQFLTIKLEIPGQPKPVIRTYSLSDYIEPCEYYRLSIKREQAPEGLQVPAGLASNFMHDCVREGTVIAAKPPSGRFVLNVHESLPAVLISNGVGITPMISMAKAASQLNHPRPIWFVHGARNGKFHAFRDQVMQLAEQNSNLMLHYVYSRPTKDDTDFYHSTGYVDTNLIQHLVAREAEYFLCGSPTFLRSLRKGLQHAGVPESRIFFEVFTKGKIGVTEKAPTDSANENANNNAEIVFAKSSKTATWEPGNGTILEFAEANDLDPPYSCRQGICGTCMCKLREGEVEYQQQPIAEIEPGSVLICISKPKTAIVLDL